MLGGVGGMGSLGILGSKLLGSRVCWSSKEWWRSRNVRGPEDGGSIGMVYIQGVIKYP